MRKVIRVAFIPIIALSIFSSIWWIVGSTAGLNRFWGIIGTNILTFLVLPLLAMAVFAFFRIVRPSPKKALSLTVIITLGILMTTISIFLIGIAPTVSEIPDAISSDSIRPTDDGLYEYRFELVNAFQRNASARLFVRDLETQEEMYISLPISMRGIHGLSTPAGREFLWARMERDEVSGYYILKMPAGRDFRSMYIGDVEFHFRSIATNHQTIYRTFQINIQSRTATIISTD